MVVNPLNVSSGYLGVYSQVSDTKKSAFLHLFEKPNKTEQLPIQADSSNWATSIRQGWISRKASTFVSLSLWGEYSPRLFKTLCPHITGAYPIIPGLTCTARIRNQIYRGTMSWIHIEKTRMASLRANGGLSHRTCAASFCCPVSRLLKQS